MKFFLQYKQMNPNNKTYLMEVLKNFTNESKQKKIIKKAEELYLIKSFKIKNMSYDQFVDTYDRICEKYQSEEIKIVSNDWHKNQRRLFLWYLVCYCEENKIQFQKIDNTQWEIMALSFFNKSPLFLKFQALTIQKNINRYKWTPYDDKLLQKYVDQLGSDSWNQISKSIFFYEDQARFISPKQCRERWFNHVCKQINKQEWTVEQDLMILKLSIKIGKKWSQIARDLKTNRTEHMVKNRYNSIINKGKIKKTETVDNIIKRLISTLQQTVNKIKQDKFSHPSPKIHQDIRNYKCKKNEVIIEIKNYSQQLGSGNGIILSQSTAGQGLFSKGGQFQKEKKQMEFLINKIPRGVLDFRSQEENNQTFDQHVISLTPSTFPPISPFSNNFLKTADNWGTRCERRRADGSSLFSPVQFIGYSPSASSPLITLSQTLMSQSPGALHPFRNSFLEQRQLLKLLKRNSESNVQQKR